MKPQTNLRWTTIRNLEALDVIVWDSAKRIDDQSLYTSGSQIRGIKAKHKRAKPKVLGLVLDCGVVNVHC